MKSIKRFAKRTLSLILCLAMVMTTMFFFDMGLVEPEAKVVEKNKVVFYVPEVIYLYPNAFEWRDTTQTPFQYYIENTVDINKIFDEPKPNTNLNKTGMLYFGIEEGFDGSINNLVVTSRYLDLNFNDMGLGNLEAGGYVVYNYAAMTTTSNAVSIPIASGKSPNLAAGTQGCYIEWTLHYTNKAGERQSLVAYTYVYKPYTTPYGGVVWTKNRDTTFDNDDQTAHQITWVSGVHQVTAATTQHSAWAYPKFGTANSMAGFLSKESRGYVGNVYYEGAKSTNIKNGVSGVSYASGAEDMYAVFSSSGYFYDFASGSGNVDCWSWFNNSNSGTYPINSFDHHTVNDHQNNESNNLNVTSSGKLYIDTSRYSNLSQIPNLGVALMVTNNTGSNGGSWYVADATGYYNKYQTGRFDGAENRATFYNAHGTIMASVGGEADGNMPSGDLGQYEGRKYSGVWLSAIDKTVSEKQYAVKGYYGNKDNQGDHALAHVTIPMTAVQSDKTALRQAVDNAVKSFATLGVKEDFGSYYYDTNSLAWQDFVSAYKAACRDLVKLDGAPNANSAANLNATVNALKSGAGRRYYFNVNHDNINPNLYVYQDNGSTVGGVTPTYNSAEDTVTLNGTQTGDAYFTYTPFTPVAGDYRFTIFKTKGTISNQTGCMVFEAYSDVPRGQLPAYTGGPSTDPNSDRRKYDYKPSNPTSPDPQTNSTTINFGNSVTTGVSLAYGTDLLCTWIWRSSSDAVFSDFTYKVKIEKGNTQTEYSPAGRVSSEGKYNYLPKPTRTGYDFAGWYTNPQCTGTAVTASTEITSDMLYAKWTPQDLRFGNEFNFDKFDWTTDANNTATNIDYTNNTITLKSNSNSEGYTNKWNTNNQPGYMTLVPGVMYEFSADYKNLSGSATAVRMMMFAFDSTNSGDFGSDTANVVVNNIAAGSSGTVKGYFKMPAGKAYATIRIGIYQNVSGTEVQFSNISVRAVPTMTDVAVQDTSISRPDPLFKQPDANGNVSGFPAITRDGYAFLGWSTERDPATGCGKASNIVTSHNVGTGKLVLYPCWSTTPITYTVQFNANYSGSTETATQSIVYTNEVALRANTFVRPMYMFDKWTTNPDGTGTSYTDGQSVKNLGVREGQVVQLYAQWKPGPEVMFGNEFDFDKLVKQEGGLTVDYLNDTIGASVASGKAETTTGYYEIELERDHVYRISYTYDPLGTVSQGQYHAWFSDSNTFGDGTNYYGGQASQKGTTTPRPSAHTYMGLLGEAYGNTAAAVIPEDANQDGKYWVRLRLDFDNHSAGYADAVQGQISNIYIYDVTADTTISIPKPIQITGYPGQTISADEFPEVTRRGYHLLGWSLTKNAMGTGSKPAIPSVTLDENGTNKTVYAIWEPNTYYIRYNKNQTAGDSVQVEGTMPDQQMTYGVGGSIARELGYTYDGYKFFGWNTKPDGTGKYYHAGDYVENLTDVDGGYFDLYAIWKYDSEVLFGNMIYFDQFYGKVESQENVSIDVETNSLTITEDLSGGSGSGSGSSSVESYVNDFGPFTNTFVEGNTYVISYDFEVLEGEAGTQVHLWFGDVAKDGEENAFQGTNHFQPGLYEPNNSSTPTTPVGEVTHVFHEFTIPEGRPDLKVRLDVDVAEGCEKVVAKITNVYFYCRTNPSGFADDLSIPYDKDTGEKLVEITGKPRTFVSAEQFPVQERTGYEFLGWSNVPAGNGNGSASGIVTDGVYLPSGDERLVLYSVWKAIDYTIRFDPNGGKITTGTGFADEPMTYDEDYTIPTNNNIYVRDNAMFTGWNTKDDGSGETYTDGMKVKNLTAEKGGTGYLYAQWQALPEVIYGNLFDFDKYLWEVPGVAAADPYYMDIKVDNVSNTLTMRTDENVGTGDCYTNIYHAANQTGAMPIVPGRTYEFSFKYKNNSDKEAPIRAVLFESRDTTVSKPNSYNHEVEAAASGTAGSEGTYRATFTAGEEQRILTLRFGVDGRPAETVMNLDVEISEIIIRDITDYSDDLEINEISGITRYADKLPSVENKNQFVYNHKFGEFDDLRRDHYTFLGWSTTLDLETGNGDIDGKVTSHNFDDAAIENGTCENITLYPIWAAHVVVVEFDTVLKAHVNELAPQVFKYGEATMPSEVTNPRFTIDYYNGETHLLSLTQYVEAKLVSWEGYNDLLSKSYSYAAGTPIKNPNDFIGRSNEFDSNTPVTKLVAKWKNDGDSQPAALVSSDGYVLKGWTETKGSQEVDFKVGAPIAAAKDMQLYAIWLEIETQDTAFEKIENTYDQTAEIVTGVTITESGDAEPIVSDKHYVYDREDIDEKLAEYEAAKNAFTSNKTAETNNALLDSIKNVENVGPAEDSDKNGLVLDYLEEFEIRYADNVTNRPVDPGKYQIKNMNLNHYTTESLDAALAALKNTAGFSATEVSLEKQKTINNSVVTLAKTYAEKEDIQESTPVYNVYDTVESMEESGLIESDDLTSVNYVYTGKGNYTYYCYTSEKNPTILITVDDLKTAADRYCYPTTAQSVRPAIITKGATTQAPAITVTTDEAAASVYEKYFAANMGVNVAENSDIGVSYYSQKAVIELKPNFEAASDKATVSYQLMAQDDAYAATPSEVNYADASKLTSGKGILDTIPASGVTPENMFTIIVDYHDGKDFDVTGGQTETDEWINQYHLTRISGGASNWELPMPGDTVYTVNDQTFGRTDYGSFTYTFVLGEANDFENCVLKLDMTNGVNIEEVKNIVRENYTEIVKQKFDGAQELWQWKTDPADGVWKYMCTHEAGTGLGYLAWSNSNWSFNYYPKSYAYTYVHLVDRWGNVVDKVIKVPKLDASSAQLHTSSAGTVDVIELGGSGIDTMSFSAQTFDIITDENSVFDGETFTTTGNTIKLYTGEANKKYTLAANDVATNKTTADVTTDAEGYLTITVEDKDFDKESGMYTFSLNGTQINLYGETEEVPERGVTNVEYTPSVSTRNEFKFTAIGRPDKIQVIEPDGGTRTYDRYHDKVSIASYDAEGNEVGAMSRELSYEVWTIEMNVPAGIELTAIARYGREWSKEAPYKYTVILAEPVFDDEVYSMELEKTEGWQGKVKATVVTGLDVSGVRFIMDNNTTTTYYASTEADGRLTYVGNAWMNHSGDNIIKVKIRVNNKWIDAGELSYYAI